MENCDNILEANLNKLLSQGFKKYDIKKAKTSKDPNKFQSNSDKPNQAQYNPPKFDIGEPVSDDNKKYSSIVNSSKKKAKPINLNGLSTVSNFKNVPFGNISKTETDEEEDKIIKEKIKKNKRDFEELFSSPTVELGDLDFTDPNGDNKTHNSFKILPQINIRFKLSKKDTINFLKEGKFEKLKEELYKILNAKFIVTNLRFDSLSFDIILYLGEPSIYYLKGIVEGNRKKSLEVFEKISNKLSNATFNCFKYPNLKPDIEVLNFEKTKEQVAKIKECLGSSNQSNFLKFIKGLIKLIASEGKKQEQRLYRNISNLDKAVENMIKDSKILIEELENSKRDSIFDYAVTSLPIILKKSILYERKRNSCKNCQEKILFHGSGVQSVVKILSYNFKVGSGKLGIGSYFSDMLDYVYCYSSKSSKIPKVGSTFYILGAEVFFDKKKINRIDNDDYYYKNDDKDFTPTEDDLVKKFPKKCAEKGGINYGISEGVHRKMLRDSNVSNFKDKFVGREYLITYTEQINPICGLSLKRAEYCVIWRDPNYGTDTAFGNHVEKMKKFIDDEVNYNLYVVAKVEDALNLVRKKRFNKIILISNIGIRYGGRYFAEQARKILGFNAVVLFQSYDTSHLKEDWLKNFPNALFSNKEEFLQEYVTNFNETGLKRLKKKIEDCYNCKFKEFEEPFKYPYFLNDDTQLNDINCQSFELYKHKFLPNPDFNL